MDETTRRPTADITRHPTAGAATTSGSAISPTWLTLVLATVLTGLSAGFFFAYEASVTLALADVGDATYVETFQAINETVRNPAFAIVFFGSVPAIALALVVNWATAVPIQRNLIAAALVLYLGGLVITGTGNVPLNDDLATVEVTSGAVAAEARAAFEDDWNQLDLLRTVAIGASFVALATAGVFVPSRRSPGRDSSDGQTERP